MKVLVTGGDGFIGRHLCHYLSMSHEVHIVDNFRFGSHRRPYQQVPGIIVHQCDIRDFIAIQKIISITNPEIVFHLAAIHFIPECEKEPDLAISTNVIGTVNLVRALIGNTRLIFASTGAVYAPDTNSHIENVSSIKPSDIYGFTKLQGEHYIKYLADLKGIHTRIVRLFNVIGPGETNRHVLPVIIAQLLNGRRKLSLGNIHPRRDYIHVQDAVEGFVAIGLMDEGSINSGEVLNIGTSKHYSVEDIVGILAKIIGDEIVIEIDPKRVRETDRPLLCADVSKTTNLTGWKPKFSMEASLKDIWADPDLPLSIIEESF